jgi:hypothetical protein
MAGQRLLYVGSSVRCCSTSAVCRPARHPARPQASAAAMEETVRDPEFGFPSTAKMSKTGGGSLLSPAGDCRLGACGNYSSKVDIFHYVRERAVVRGSELAGTATFKDVCSRKLNVSKRSSVQARRRTKQASSNKVRPWCAVKSLCFFATPPLPG